MVRDARNEVSRGARRPSPGSTAQSVGPQLPPLNLRSDVVQFLVPVPNERPPTSLEPPPARSVVSQRTYVAGLLAHLVSMAEARRLSVLLFHLPAAPPRGSDPALRWLRVRIGVADGQERQVIDLARQFRKTQLLLAKEFNVSDDLPPTRVSSVAEFALPDEASREEPMDYPDHSTSIAPDQPILFVTINVTAPCSGLDLLIMMPPTPGASLHSMSASSALGRDMIVLLYQLERPVQVREIERIEAEVRRTIKADGTIFVHAFARTAWAGTHGQELHNSRLPSSGPIESNAEQSLRWRQCGVRLTWRCPLRPGVVATILQEMEAAAESVRRTLHSGDDALRPNVAYVLSRTTTLGRSIGRVVFRVDLGLLEEHRGAVLGAFMRELEERTEAALDRLVDGDHPTAPRVDIVVSVEPFAQATSSDTQGAEKTFVPVEGSNDSS